MNNDLISRQAAIDALGDIHPLDYNGLAILEKIKALPSAQPDWELFDLITSAYYGKMMYAQQDHGLVYSRYSGKYMTMDDAVREFVRMLSWEGEADETD